MSVVIWYEVLYKINVVSKLLQAEDCDMSQAVNALKNISAFLSD